MKLLTNNNFENELKALAADATEIRVLIAFLTEDGLTWLPKDKYDISRFIVGVNLGITTPDSLRSLQAGKADVRVFHDPNKLFHPKAVYVKTQENEYLIVGSNNLTGRGISSNYELSTLSQRDENNEAAFSDFLIHFDSLLSQKYCYRPDEQFYKEYTPTSFQQNLSEKIALAGLTPRTVSEDQELPIGDARLTSLSKFIQALSEQYLKRDRKHGQRVKISDHSLNKLNDDEFRPLFEQIVSNVSKGRLKGYSELLTNNKAKWRTIPLIEALDENREPWENASRNGRIALQIHFSEDFAVVRFSLVLHYTLDISIRNGEMPEAVSKRSERLSDHIDGYREGVNDELDCFKLWSISKDRISAWAKPLLQFEHEVRTLPDDKVLYEELALLVNVLDGAVLIR